jgi:hypothetical protein
MSKALSKSLKMDLPALAELLRSKGRGNDSMLAHITPREAALLKRRGGSGTTNPDTGLPEFDDGFDVGGYFGGQTGGTFTPSTPDASFQAPTSGADYTPVTPTVSADQATANQQAYGFGGTPTPTFDLTSQPGYGAAVQPGAAQIPAQTTAAFMQGEPGQLTPAQLSSTQPEPAAQAPTTPTTDKSTLEKLGLTGKDLTRMGLGALLTGGLAATNISRTRQAQQQAQQAQGQQQALATPYQEQGKALVTQAQAGQLSPQSQAAYKAAQAQINQNVANRGGVGVQQAANELATVYQNLLANQYQLGNSIMNIGDQYALGAIKTGLQADQAVNQANQQFYTALAQMAAPFLMGQQPVYQVPTTTRT